MSQRSVLCRALDVLGIGALAAAALALGGALGLGGSAGEGLLLAVFRYGLGGAVGLLLTARTCEIARILRRRPPLPAQPAALPPPNVRSLPQRDDLTRAA